MNHPKPIRTTRHWWIPIALASAMPPVTDAAPKYLGPSAVLASPDGGRIFVACADAAKVMAIDLASGKPGASATVPGEPTGLALSPDGKILYATCGIPDGVVCVIDPATMKVTGKIAAGHTPTGAAPHPDGKRLYVCNRFNNDVSVFDLATKKEIRRIAVPREPFSAAVTPDGSPSP